MRAGGQQRYPPLPHLAHVRGHHGLALAGLGVRLGARLIDMVLYIPAAAGGGLLFDALRTGADEAWFLGALYGIGLLFIYQAYLLTKRGQTLGKRLLKIRIADYHDGRNPGFTRTVLMRTVVPEAVSFFIGVFGLVDVLFIFGAERRCVHDLMAGTSVVDGEAVAAVEASVFE